MRAPDPTYGPLELVDWLDSQTTYTGWVDMEDIPPERPVCGHLRTVGWVLRENDEAVLIAQSVGSTPGGSDQACHVMTIPKVAITKRTPL